jgi:uncharacterized protein YndB with AHSA1/START domain
MPSSTTDKITRSVTVNAPRSRVWRAVTDLNEFNTWFSTTGDKQFQQGQRTNLVSTHPGKHEGTQFWVEIVRMQPEEFFSWRWHPGVAPPGNDRATEPMTLVEFHLREVPGGTEVTVIESGFDSLWESRRASQFKENTAGWEFQLAALERYFAGAK